MKNIATGLSLIGFMVVFNTALSDPYPYTDFEHSCKYSNSTYGLTIGYKETLWGFTYPPEEISQLAQYPNGSTSTMTFYVNEYSCEPIKMYYQDTIVWGGLDGDHDTDGLSNLEEVSSGSNPLEYFALPNACHLPGDAYFTNNLWEEVYGTTPPADLRMTSYNVFMNDGVEDAINFKYRSGFRTKRKTVNILCDKGIVRAQ